jgi:hypothetical protein
MALISIVLRGMRRIRSSDSRGMRSFGIIVMSWVDCGFAVSLRGPPAYQTPTRLGPPGGDPRGADFDGVTPRRA